MGKARKKKKLPEPQAEDSETVGVPRSFVFHRGNVGKTIINLVSDMKHVMQPFTALNLKATKSNVLKDFVHVAGPYGVSHFIVFSKTETSPYLKICRLPRGPTLTFKVNEYSLMKDVVNILKRPKSLGQQFKQPSLAVLNGFSNNEMHVKLMSTVFQNMFPPLKVQKVKLTNIRRCSVFDYDSSSGLIEFRHFNIEAKPTGLSRGVKKLLKNKIPDLGKLDDISDFMAGAAYLSESEGEEPEEARVTLPQAVRGRGNMKSSQSAIRLCEIGPRLQLMLLKIEEGVCEGEVLYHKYESKTKKEVKELKVKKAKAKEEKDKRRQEQEKNVARKQQEKEEHKQRSLAGIKRKMEEEKPEGEAKSEEEKEAEDQEVDNQEVEEDKSMSDDIGEEGDNEEEEEVEEEIEEEQPKIKKRRQQKPVVKNSPKAKPQFKGNKGRPGGKVFNKKYQKRK